jgi:hypothetical protein
MASPLEVQLILCDAAQADRATGKVHMLGAGWSVTAGQAPHAVALLVKVPWDRANERLDVMLEMRDGDGHPVLLDGDQGRMPLRALTQLEVGRPAGLAPGSPLDASFALSVPPLPLPPGRYEWHLTIAEQTRTAPFTVRPDAGPR